MRRHRGTLLVLIMLLLTGCGPPLLPPQADFTYAPAQPKVNEEITFDGSRSTGPRITSYLWDFGDGTFGDGITTRHRYAGPGTYRVTLDVYDDRNKRGSKSIALAVTARPAPARTGRVVINEVELNPAGDDRLPAVREWVELYNASDQAIDMTGWILQSTTGERNILEGFICAGGYIVIEPRGYCVIEASNWLDNQGERFILQDQLGKLIDMTPKLTDREDDARAWSRCPNGMDTDLDSDWKYVPSSKGVANRCS